MGTLVRTEASWRRSGMEMTSMIGIIRIGVARSFGGRGPGSSGDIGRCNEDGSRCVRSASGHCQQIYL